MKTDSRLAINLQKSFCAAPAAVIGVLLCALGTTLPAVAQSTPIVLPYTINTIAGTGSSGAITPGPAAASEIGSDLRAIAVDAQGDIYFADGTNNVVGEINGKSGVISTVAGGASTVCSAHTDEAGDGCLAATQTKLDEPRGLALDKSGNLYIADYGHSLVEVVNKQTGIMTRVAGAVANAGDGGTKSYSGDGGQANVAALNEPRCVRVDNNGNIWICDTGNNVIREVNASTGVISTVVGTDANGTSASTGGFTGDGTAANSSGVELNEPTDIVFDKNNNAYIVDFNNKRIREVTANNDIINTIIGNGGTPATTAPVGPQTASSAALGDPTKIDIDSNGNLYFADSTESVIYFYDAETQTISIIAGEYGYAGSTTGFTVCANNSDTLGDGCPATQALFYQGTSALGVAVDSKNNLYITDPSDERIREVFTNLNFPAESIGSTATQTVLVHFDANDAPAAINGIVIGSTPGDFTQSAAASCAANGDTTTNCTLIISFKPIDPGQRSTPLVVDGLLSHRTFPLTGTGNGVAFTIDPATASLLGTGLSASHGATLDAAGNLYIADTGNNRVVKISGGTQTVFAGTGTSGSGGNGGLATAATLNAPTAVTVGPGGIVYIADTGNNEVRAVDPVTGIITVYAGGGTACTTASPAIYPLPIDTEGDGCQATQATLKSPSGLAADSNGNLYIADTGDNLIRTVNQRTGTIYLYAGLITGNALCTTAANPDSYGDGCPLNQASFKSPSGLALDGSGDLFVADSGDNIIRELSPSTGLVTKVAGNGQSVFDGDGGLATAASLDAPSAVKVDAAGDLYIADTGNAAVRFVAATSGDISTLLGQGGTPGSAGGTGSATLLQFTSPSGIAIDSLGNVYVSDTGNNRVAEDNRNLGILAFGRDNTGVVTPEQTATFTNIGNQALTFTNTPPYTATGDTSDFPIDTTPTTTCSGSGIAVSANCTLAASFDPTATATYAENITIASNAVNQGTAMLQLTGDGVQLATTTTTLVQTTPTGAVSYGEQTTFTATVAPTSGNGTSTGSITFSVNGKSQPQPVTLSNTGTATLTVSLPVGSNTIAAVYSGDDTYATSNNSLTVPVSQAGTTTTLTISPTTQIYQQSVTFTSQVTSDTTGIPTGTVSFVSGTTVLGPVTVDPTGKATLTTTTLPVASYSFTAQYTGVANSNYATSSSQPMSLVINPIPPGFTATASSTTLTVPQGGTVATPITLTPAGGITGTVTFSCAGLPANTTCGFFPTTITLPTLTPLVDCPPLTVQAICTELTITTNVPPVALSQVQRPFTGRSARILSAAVFFPVLLFGIGLFDRKKRRIATIALSLIFLSGFTLLSGCSSNPTQTAAMVTPVGTSTVIVTMTGPDNVTKTVSITLNVLAATPVTAKVTYPNKPTAPTFKPAHILANTALLKPFSLL
jgi:streptogramin lyase